jgi:hypothetical protein
MAKPVTVVPSTVKLKTPWAGFVKAKYVPQNARAFDVDMCAANKPAEPPGPVKVP